MANKGHLSIVKRGVRAWNKWRSEHPKIIPDLNSADLSGANLHHADLSRSDLSGANLKRANLYHANLHHADLSESELSEASLTWTNLIQGNLFGAHLFGADLNRADLREADLRGANLIEANLSRAYLPLANLGNSTMGSTSLADIDLSEVKGLETVKHLGPSSIDIDTIYRSKGDIPDVFLRGAGVPDSFIEQMKFLVGTATAIEFYSCFISYSTKDKEFAERLYADLQREHVRCWFAPQDMRSGRKLEEQIDVAIRLHERLLLILSPDSMKSEWVKTEIAKARKREIQEKKQVLFPVRLVSFETIRDWECFDADAGKDSAREIREYFIPDFSNWRNPAQYKVAFDRLLSDLKSEDRPKII